MPALRVRFVALLLSILPAIDRGASAEIVGDASVGFTAERTLIIDGQRYVGMMWHMPGEQRHEQVLPAMKSVLILRDGSKVVNMILPQLHTVVQFPLPSEFSLLADRGLLRNPVAQETVNGIATMKYAVEKSSPSGRASGSLWLSHEGIPMKCDAKFEAGKGKVRDDLLGIAPRQDRRARSRTVRGSAGLRETSSGSGRAPAWHTTGPPCGSSLKAGLEKELLRSRFAYLVGAFSERYRQILRRLRDCFCNDLIEARHLCLPPVICFCGSASPASYIGSPLGVLKQTAN